MNPAFTAAFVRHMETKGATTMTNVKKGMRFYHSRVLDGMKFDGKSPQLFVVTKVTKAAIYYRAVYDYGDREELGAPAYSDPAGFSRWVASVVSQ